jgi:hypothetical protein
MSQPNLPTPEGREAGAEMNGKPRPKKDAKVRKQELAGCTTEQESCLFTLLTDGTLYLSHAEMDIVNEDGEQVGHISFNGMRLIPPSDYTWAWVHPAPTTENGGQA